MVEIQDGGSKMAAIRNDDTIPASYDVNAWTRHVAHLN